MSSEQDTALVSPSAPVRRRIVVAPKLADKPLALIVRDAELQAEFEAELAHARKVVVFPSLTHLCTDPVRTAWAGVVVARACGFDARLSALVPENCIAFWRVSEESYGWPSEVSQLNTREELERWLEEIKNPRPITRIVTPKRVAKPRPSPVVKRQAAPKTQLKFELAVPRGVVESERPRQMPLAGIPAEPITPPAPSSNGAAVSVNPAAEAQTKALSEPAPTASKPGRKRKAARAEQLPLPATQVAAKPSAAELERIKRAVLREGASGSRQQELQLMRLAAELGVTRAQELLEALRIRASTFR